MAVVAWILFGLVTGFIASKLVNSTGSSVILDAVLGIVGGLAGGFSCSLMGAGDVTGFNLWSLFLAVCGACLLLFLHYAASGGRSS